MSVVRKALCVGVLSAVAVVGPAVPVFAARLTAAKSSAVPALPPPSAEALAAGVKDGQGTPMGWEHRGPQAPKVTTGNPVGDVSLHTSAQPQIQMVPIATAASTPSIAAAISGSMLQGIDVSSYQGSVDWQAVYANGTKFAFIKATEGTSYVSPTFSSQYSGATNAGIPFRGAYHFARPSSSGGAVQADYFVAHGGGWSPDGRTLPGVLDIEYNPSSDGTGSCYGLSQGDMVAWLKAFSNEYQAKTGAYPIIYSTTNWWSACTGNSPALSSTNPFWIAAYNGGTGPGSLPAGVGTWSFWQYGDSSGTYPCPPPGAGDCNQFNGGQSQLQEMASGTTTFPVGSHVASGYNSGMGKPVGPEVQATLFGVTGYIQSFSNAYGVINTPSGTFVSNGSIYASWNLAADGWPTGNMYQVNAGGIAGYQQNFAAYSTSRAFWSPEHPFTLWVNGSILAKYDQLGGTNALGWPTAAMTSQTVAKVQGWVQNFQNGFALIASQYGVFADNGAIYGSWDMAADGWPTTNIYAVTAGGISGYQQDFAGPTNARAFWSPQYPSTLWVNGSILFNYEQAGGTNARGWPTAPMTSQNVSGVQGWAQTFQNGWALLASQYGVFPSNGAIFAAWSPSVGWPTAAMTTQSVFGVQGWVQNFQNGQALISSAYGTYPSNGSIYATWNPASYGWPTGNMQAVSAAGISGYQQSFAEGGLTNARAFWNPQYPTTSWVNGSILARYDQLGGTAAEGWPTAVMTSQAEFGIQGWVQNFQSGALIASSYGICASGGAILASWNAAQYGWPTMDLKSSTYQGQAGWIQQFNRGASGPDFVFALAPSGATTWHQGTP